MDKESQFQSILQANRDRIFRICCCYVRAESARQDVFQTALLHIWESLSTFKGESQISTWVFRVTVNTCLAHLRGQRRERHMMTDLSGRVRSGEPLASPAPTEACGTRDDIRRLYACIHELSPIDRILVSLCLEEASPEEIAEVLGISPGNARVRVHRLKKVLKEIWERTGGGLE